MENNINNPEIINDIIKINNDRIEGYKKAIDLATSHGLDKLIPTFQKFIGQSEEFIAELTPYVELEGKEATDSTMLSGKLFRAWMGIKVNITEMTKEVCSKPVSREKMPSNQLIKQLWLKDRKNFHKMFTA